MSRNKRSKDNRSALEQLELFGRRAVELHSTRFIQSGTLENLSFKFSGEQIGEQFKVQFSMNKEIDEEDLRSFLLTFRQFISDNEPIYIHKIFNLCHQFLNDDHLKGELVKARADWNKIMQGQDGLSFTVDEKELTPEYVLRVWINGHYFHNDSEYAEDIRRFNASPIPLDRMRFLMALGDLANIIFYTGNTVNYALKNDLFEE